MHKHIKQLKKQPETAAVGNRWTPEEETRLIDSLGQGKDIDEIAKEHKRTSGGIRSRMSMIALRMIESEGKSIEEVCVALHMTSEEIEDAKKQKEINHSNVIKKSIDGLLEKGISLIAIKDYITTLNEIIEHKHEYKTYYAVARGHVPGIYATWDEAKAQLVGYKGVKHKKFKTHEEAEEFIKAELACSSTTSSDEMIREKDQRESSQQKSNLVAFTDGACINNNSTDLESRLAGYAVLWPHNQSYNKSCKIINNEKKTNNRAELLAFLEAIKISNNIDPLYKRTLEVYTDSELVIKTHKFIEQWKKNKWRRSDNKPLSNVDILEDIHNHRGIRDIVIKHVEAHTNNNDWASQWNAKVDQAAREAALQ